MRATTRALRLGAGLTITAIAGLGAAGLVYGIDHDPHLAPSYTVSDHRPTITEDDPRWNCLTMGNHKCGPTWLRLNAGDGKAINKVTGLHRDWTVCLRDTETEWIACPDGTVWDEELGQVTS